MKDLGVGVEDGCRVLGVAPHGPVVLFSILVVFPTVPKHGYFVVAAP